MDGDDPIIDLVQSSDGSYVPENEIVLRKPKQKVVVEKQFHEQVDDFLDGVIEGQKVCKKIFKAFGV